MRIAMPWGRIWILPPRPQGDRKERTASRPRLAARPKAGAASNEIGPAVSLVAAASPDESGLAVRRRCPDAPMPWWIRTPGWHRGCLQGERAGFAERLAG